MDHLPFPWTETLKPVTESRPPPEKKTKPLYWSVTGSIFLLLLVGALYFRHDRAKQEAPVPYLVGIAPMLALPKGSQLETAVLKEMPLDFRSLTKTQRRQLLNPEDLPLLNGKLRSKKDLAPNRILFWSDLEMIQNPILPKSRKMIISKDNL